MIDCEQQVDSMTPDTYYTQFLIKSLQQSSFEYVSHFNTFVKTYEKELMIYCFWQIKNIMGSNYDQIMIKWSPWILKERE